jgi:hypothetical protein
MKKLLTILLLSTIGYSISLLAGEHGYTGSYAVNNNYKASSADCGPGGPAWGMPVWARPAWGRPWSRPVWGPPMWTHPAPSWGYPWAGTAEERARRTAFVRKLLDDAMSTGGRR